MVIKTCGFLLQWVSVFLCIQIAAQVQTGCAYRKFATTSA